MTLPFRQWGERAFCEGLSLSLYYPPLLLPVILVIIWLLFFCISRLTSLRHGAWEYLAHFKPNGEEEQKQCSLTKESSTEAHTYRLPATLHLTKQSAIALTSLVLGTACGISVSWWAPGSRQATAEESFHSICLLLPRGNWGKQEARVVGWAPWHSWGCAVPPGLGGQGYALAGFLQSHCFSFWKYNAQCCNKMWCSYIETKLRKWVVLNYETIINSRTSQ